MFTFAYVFMSSLKKKQVFGPTPFIRVLHRDIPCELIQYNTVAVVILASSVLILEVDRSQRKMTSTVRAALHVAFVEKKILCDSLPCAIHKVCGVETQIQQETASLRNEAM